MRVKIKPEDLLRYIRDGLSAEQMAQKEEVTTVTIWKHINKIDKELVNQAKREGEELRILEKQKRILGYIRQNLTREEIAKKEEITEVTLWSYIKNNIDEGLLNQAEQDAKELKQIERQKRILGYIRQKLTQEEMAKEEGVSKVTIWKYIKEIDKELIDKAKNENEEMWKQTQKDLEDIIQQLMCESEERWQKLTENYEERIKELKNKNDESEEFKKIQKQEKLLGYIRGNLTQEQMAKQEGVSKSTIQRHIYKIDEDLIKQAQQDAKELEQMERQKRILGYIRGRLTKEQMAKQEGVKRITIYRCIRKMDEDLINRAKNEDEKAWEQTEQEQESKFQQLIYESEERWKNLIQNYETRSRLNKDSKSKDTKIPENPKVILEKSTSSNKLASIMKEKIKSRTITQKDIDIYKERLYEKYDEMKYEELTLLIKAYIETNQIEEAIKFLNSIIYNRDMAYLGVEKLNQLKTSVEQIKKKQYACSLIESGKKTTAEIAQIVRFKGNRDYKNKK